MANRKGGVNLTNSNKLRAKIRENGFTQKEVAEKIGISLQSLSYKINNKIEFIASEMERLFNLLDITDKVSYFFYSSNSQNG